MTTAGQPAVLQSSERNRITAQTNNQKEQTGIVERYIRRNRSYIEFHFKNKKKKRGIGAEMLQVKLDLFLEIYIERPGRFVVWLRPIDLENLTNSTNSFWSFVRIGEAKESFW